ncbi:hypothetical protein Micbo1qcDRAFT_165436 [Microdochium bolleyi]|uniref:Uncharacterized protein n=1 Tax=Microdochium bolleyi TaxID=196109 RepID=A0A136IWU2_9PEZI|nr:hypothetical protein Micbo1qcDRAFT_165436 [Microdochium bolleyi]
MQLAYLRRPPPPLLQMHVAAQFLLTSRQIAISLGYTPVSVASPVRHAYCKRWVVLVGGSRRPTVGSMETWKTPGSPLTVMQTILPGRARQRRMSAVSPKEPNPCRC